MSFLPRPAVAAAGLLAAGVAGALVWRSLRGGREGGPGPFPDAPVVLVSIDTLRADRLPAYGYARGATPTLDGLAREGIVFEDVYSHCPLTGPAHASLFTGLTPPHHGLRDNTGFALDPSHPTLATRFRQAGAETGAAVSAYVLRRATGLAAGFDWYEDAIETDSAEESLGGQQRDGAVAAEALAAWIEARAGRRFFAFLHLYEPHTPWAPPPAHRSHPHPYDGEVAYADELVGRFLARLRAAGVLERAIVAVTSDHGEGLGDHGEQEHGLFLYREAVRVPLIVHLPGARARGRRVAGVVAQADVPATLLDLAGLPASGMDGLSQRESIGRGRAPARPVYSETLFPRYHFGWSELFAVTDERLRFIRAPKPELYDVRSDPAEKQNLAGERPAAVAAMSAWLAKQGTTATLPTPAAVPADVRERLEALGYVGSAPAPAAPGADLPDPKDQIQAYEAFKAAGDLRRQGKDAEAVAALERVLADSPGMLDARETLGSTLFRLGRAREAEAALEAVLAVEPQRGTAHLALARLHAATGRREKAEEHAALAAASEPGEAYQILGQLRLEAGRPDEAEAFARRAVEADPTRAVAHYVLGQVARRRGRCPEALEALARAEEAMSRRRGLRVPGVHAARADCLARLGREAEAETAFRAEIRDFPSSREGRVGLAILYRSRSRDEDARAALAGIVEAHPHPGPEEYWAVVRTLAGLGDREGARAWAQRARERFPRDPRFR